MFCVSEGSPLEYETIEMNFMTVVARLKTSHKDIQLLADPLLNCRLMIYLYLFYSQDDFKIHRVVFVVVSVEEY